MENHLGRLLDANEVVHHKDGNKFNNDLSNLEVMDAREHVSIPGRLHGRKWAELKCPWRGNRFTRPFNIIFVQKKSSKLKATCCSAHCRGKLSSEIKNHGITRKLETAISENIIRVFYKHSYDNSEETPTSGSVETIRGQAGMPKK